jgi:hypothetical protein
VADGVTGVLVPPPTPMRWRRHPHLLEDLTSPAHGEAGHRRIERRFTWRETARQTVDL